MSKKELSWREVAFCIFGMMFVLVAYTLILHYIQYFPSSVQGVMYVHGMDVRTTFYYNDSVTYKDDSWHIQYLNWTIYIYDSPFEPNVFGMQWGNYIFIRSGMMPNLIHTTCEHEVAHVLGADERFAYYFQWQSDVPPCSYLFNLADNMFLSNQTKYHEVFG